MRRIIAEDPDWCLDQVPFLSRLCLQSIVKNIEVKRIYAELSPSEQQFVQEKLPLSASLTVTSSLIPDGVYWQRRCKQLWDICDVSDYGQSWKRMFFERYLEGLIELFIPGETEPRSVLEMVPLCKNYVKRLNISQLLPPVKEPHKEDEEDWTELSSNIEQDDKPPLDHFNFAVLLEKLQNLEELRLVYRVKQCGMNFEWEMFRMTRRDCETLAQALKSCRTLKSLHLYLSHVDDAQCRLLVRHLLDHPSLTELKLTLNTIGDRGARAVGRLLNQSRLRTLDLFNNDIGDGGAKAIAHALSTNATLELLNLGLNRVGDAGGQALAQALLKNRSLQDLNLEGNELSGRTAVSFATVVVQNTALKRINLFLNNLGVEGGKALREAMSKNSTLTDFDVARTNMEEADADFIDEAVWSNKERAKRKITETQHS